MTPLNAPYPNHGSHLPVLVLCAMELGGELKHVLEIGAGSCSTPWLAQVTLTAGARLHTIEESEQWSPAPMHPQHTVGPYWNAMIKYPWSNQDDDDMALWDIVLVDNGANCRADHVSLLRDSFWSARFIVCHDTEPENDSTYRWTDSRVLDGCDRVDVTCPWYRTRTTVIGESIPLALKQRLLTLNAAVGPWGDGAIARAYPEQSALARTMRAAAHTRAVMRLAWSTLCPAGELPHLDKADHPDD